MGFFDDRAVSFECLADKVFGCEEPGINGMLEFGYTGFVEEDEQAALGGRGLLVDDLVVAAGDVNTLETFWPVCVDHEFKYITLSHTKSRL